MTASGRSRAMLANAPDISSLPSNCDRPDIKPQAVGTLLKLFKSHPRERIIRIVQDGYMAGPGQNIPDQFEILRTQFRRGGRNAGDIAARPREAGYQSGCNRIARGRHDNRNFAGGFSRRGYRGRQRGDDDVDLAANEFRRQVRKAIDLTFCRASLELYVSAIKIAEIAKRFTNGPMCSVSVKIRMPMRGIFCCARAASGHAAAPPSSVMNSRRSIIRSPRRHGPAARVRLTRPGTGPRAGRRLPGDIILALPNDGNARFSIPSRAWR